MCCSIGKRSRLWPRSWCCWRSGWQECGLWFLITGSGSRVWCVTLFCDRKFSTIKACHVKIYCQFLTISQRVLKHCKLSNPLLSPSKCSRRLRRSLFSWFSNTRGSHHESCWSWQWLKAWLFFCRSVNLYRSHATRHDIELQINSRFD